MNFWRAPRLIGLPTQLVWPHSQGEVEACHFLGFRCGLWVCEISTSVPLPPPLLFCYSNLEKKHVEC